MEGVEVLYGTNTLYVLGPGLVANPLGKYVPEAYLGMVKSLEWTLKSEEWGSENLRWLGSLGVLPVVMPNLRRLCIGFQECFFLWAGRGLARGWRMG